MTATGMPPLDAEFTRLPPHDLGAERIVLGAMMTSPVAIRDVLALPLAPGDHLRPAHQVIHEAILAQYERGAPTEPIALANLLAARGELDKVGGPVALSDCVAAVPTTANAAYYARIVAQHAIRRRAIEKATRIMQLAYAGTDDAEDVAEQARILADEILPPTAAGGAKDAETLFYEVLETLEHGRERGPSTPWADLNETVPGLAPGELIVVGASSGTGKSIAGLNMIAHAALRLNVRSAIFTMEMTAQEVMLRLIASEARVPLGALIKRNLADHHWASISAASERITSAPLVIDDSPAMSLATIRTRLREMSRTDPAGLVFVDYLGLLREPSGAENRQNAVASNARDLKNLAAEFGIPILAAAQLNREMERRHDKRPQPSDLRDSAEIEHAASVIILLYREDVHGEVTTRPGEIDFIVAKNRNGSPKTVNLLFQGEYARCVDPVREWHSRHAED